MSKRWLDRFDPDPYLYDYNSWSPCIDTGEPSYDDPDGTRIDIGAKYFDQGTMSLDNKHLPKHHTLSQNYPNPFNPTTTINYTVPTFGPVSLEIYNMLGNKVSTVIDRTVDVGSHDIHYNGSHLSSGVYFYILRYKDNSITKKFMIIK